jgi:hypothetical protein
MSEEKRYTYVIHDLDTHRKDGSATQIDEEGGPASEAKIEELVKVHYDEPYFEEQADGRILIFRSENEAKQASNAVGSVTLVE